MESESRINPEKVILEAMQQGIQVIEEKQPRPKLITIKCRWCGDDYSVLEGRKLRPAETVCDGCQEIIQDIIDYNEERSHD